MGMGEETSDKKLHFNLDLILTSYFLTIIFISIENKTWEGWRENEG